MANNTLPAFCAFLPQRQPSFKVNCISGKVVAVVLTAVSHEGMLLKSQPPLKTSAFPVHSYF